MLTRKEYTWYILSIFLFLEKEYDWNIPGIYLEYNFFSYARYIPGIFRSYTTDGHMTGIYLVYTQDLQFLGIQDVLRKYLGIYLVIT